MDYEEKENEHFSEEIEKDSDNIYSEDGAEKALDNDSIKPEEEAFIRGYIEE